MGRNFGFILVVTEMSGRLRAGEGCDLISLKAYPAPSAEWLRGRQGETQVEG